MISVTYTRHNHTFNWLQCTTRTQLEKWLKAIIDMGATNIRISVT